MGRQNLIRRALRSVLRGLKFATLAQADSRVISFFLLPILLRRMRRQFQHSGLPTPPSAFSVAPALSAEDVQLAERLLRFWAAMQRSQAASGLTRETDVWTGIISRQGSFLSVIQSGDPRVLAQYLRSAPNRSVFQGVLGDGGNTLLRENPAYRKQQSAWVIDLFVSLMESIGALSIQNPAQGSWGMAEIALDYKALLEELDRVCGSRVIVPQIFDGVLVTEIGGRHFTAVDLTAIDGALRIRRVLSSSTSKRILEIGAGSGRTAYWCVRFGLGPIQIIDLPHVAIAQAWYFAKAIPSGALHLYGEPLGDVGSPPSVSIFPDTGLDEVSKRDVGLVFNQDSFAEMSRTALTRYLQWIIASDCGVLVSTNHESEAAYASGARHLNASRILRSIDGYRLLDRERNWIRKGYVDEVFAVNGRSYGPTPPASRVGP